MEKAKISAYQLFVLIVLFQMGSSMVVPLASGAKQDAWLAILIGMAGGMCLFLIYYTLYSYYPTSLPATYVPKLVGPFLGKFIIFIYMVYFIYLSARVLRDFGDMLVAFAYPETPMFIINALLMLVIIYSVRKGIEVIARTAEIMFIFFAFILLTGSVLILISGIIEIPQLRPVLENGLKPVLKTAFSETLYFPFGEILAFIVLLPYLKPSKIVKRTGLLAIGASGLMLANTMAVNVAVLGVSLVGRTPFPLLATIQSVNAAEYLQRMDVYFMLSSIIGGFFKIAIFFYICVVGAADLFKVKESKRLVYPMGMVVLFSSILIASTYPEHLYEGIQFVPLALHLPFQVIIPVLLLLIAVFKRKKNSAAN